MADNAVDFLRFLAIGYDEICWSENYEFPPDENGDFIVQPNIVFQDWVKTSFSVETPKIALEIVKYAVDMGDEDTPDPFCNWCNKQSN